MTAVFAVGRTVFCSKKKKCTKKFADFFKRYRYNMSGKQHNTSHGCLEEFFYLDIPSI